MSKTVKRALFAMLALVILGVWGFIYVNFNGNPIKLYMARRPIMDYLSETYPHTSFIYEKPTYDFKGPAYGGRIRANTNPPVNFSAYIRNGGHIYEYFLEEKMRVEMELEIRPVLLEVLPELTSLWLKVNWDEDEVAITDDMSYSRALDLLVDTDIRWAGPPATKEAFLERCLKIEETLREEGFKIQVNTFVYDFGQDEFYLLNLSEDMLVLSEEQLVSEIYYMGK